MVKIYKDNVSKKVVIEGVYSDFSSMLSYNTINNRVSIRSLTKDKVIFNDKWENITDEFGNIFTDQFSIVNYLIEIFKVEEIVTIENQGVNFLAHYILSKNN